MIRRQLMSEHDSGIGGGWLDLLQEGVYVREWYGSRTVDYVVHLLDVNGELMIHRFHEMHDIF